MRAKRLQSAGAIGHLPLGGDIESYAMEVEGRAATFSMVDGVFLRPLPFKGAGRLYTLWELDAKMGNEQPPGRRCRS
jgi:hypothetical protein